MSDKPHHRYKPRRHFNNQTKNSWRNIATIRTAISRSLMLRHVELKSDARICWSSTCTCDVSVASLSAVSRCSRTSGSSSWCSDKLLQMAVGSCAMSVSTGCWSSSRHSTTYTLCWHCRASRLFQHWFSMSFPCQQLCKSITENWLLVDSRCQLSVAVGNSTHSESLVLHCG